MRHALALLLSSLSFACSADLILHDGGLQVPDAQLMDAGDKPDAGWPADAAAADAAPVDAGPSPCQLGTVNDVDFGRVAVGSSATLGVVLTNVGFGDCPVQADVQSAEPGFSIVGSRAQVLQPGQSMQVDIAFAPTSGGIKQGTLLVQLDDTTLPNPVADLTGDAYVEPIASTLSYGFRVTNRTIEDRYLVLEGRDCTAFDPGVPTQLSFQCGCECPPPPAAGPTRMLRLPPGGFGDLMWDTRGLVTWSVTLQCGPDFTETEVRGALQPVMNGVYPTRIAFARSLPSYCQPSGRTNEFECDPVDDSGPMLAPPLSPLCETGGVVTADANVNGIDTVRFVDITD